MGDTEIVSGKEKEVEKINEVKKGIQKRTKHTKFGPNTFLGPASSRTPPARNDVELHRSLNVFIFTEIRDDDNAKMETPRIGRPSIKYSEWIKYFDKF